MKIVINPKYQYMKDFLSEIPNFFEREGVVIYDQRNLLKVFTIGNIDVVVKRFRIPILLNRIVYTFLRSSKAVRSFKYASILLERGIETPDPIAFIEEKSVGLLRFSYYICVYEKDSVHIRKQMLGEGIDDNFIEGLAAFIAKLHDKGVLFLDLSPGNILYRKEGNNQHFLLVDINRLRFREVVTIKNRYRNVVRISGSPVIVTSLAKEYAKLKSLNEKETIDGMIQACIDHYYTLGSNNPFRKTTS
jgi:serine/threonine protein kinase